MNPVYAAEKKRTILGFFYLQCKDKTKSIIEAKNCSRQHEQKHFSSTIMQTVTCKSIICLRMSCSTKIDLSAMMHHIHLQDFC